MIGKTPTEHQMTIFETALESFIDLNGGLVLFAQRIEWSEVKNEFMKHYCKDNDRPPVPARKKVGSMFLKNRYNLGDEDVMARRMNKLSKKKLPSFASLLLKLRNRIENVIFGSGKIYDRHAPFLLLLKIEGFGKVD